MERNVRTLMVVALLAGCSTAEPKADIDMTIKQQDIAGRWPLSVDRLTVVCGSNRLAVFGEANSRAYALNGSASSNPGSYPGRLAVSDLKSIQKPDPEMAQYGKVLLDAAPVVQVAIQRCKQRDANDI